MGPMKTSLFLLALIGDQNSDLWNLKRPPSFGANRSPWRGHLRLAGRDQAKAPQKKGDHIEGNDRIQA